MNSTIYYPSKALQPYIRYYRIWDIPVADSSAAIFQDYPRTMLDMLFLFKGKIHISIADATPFELEQCSCIGQFDKNYSILTEDSIQAFNIRFKPNGIYPLTKVPLSLLVNNQLPLSDFLDRKIGLLFEQLLEQPTLFDKIKLLENYLLAIYRKGELHYKLEYALSLIHQHQGLIAVKILKEKLRVSYKSLDRWFQKNIGLSPKRFIQLTRFTHILQDLEGQPCPDWMQLVADYHFYDQAHFIKEFKQFAGICPSVYKVQPTSMQQGFPYVRP